jgi:predicted amidohydrolase
VRAGGRTPGRTELSDLAELRSLMRKPLTIAVAQPLCVPYDVAANALTHAAAVRAAGARVVVFPELSLTGYELTAPAITVEDQRLAPIVEACADSGSLALVGAPVPGTGGTVPRRPQEPTPGRSHVGILAVDGAAVTVAYRKMWLGAAEAERFTPGDAPAAVDVDGWRLGLAICKDTGVPQHASDTAALGIDAYVAGVLDSAEEAGIQDERVRRVAADHRVWVAMASFAGSTGGGYAHAAGRSRIWDRDGLVVAEAGPQPGDIARATLT